MKATKRQRQQALFGTLLAAAAIVNVLFFLILYRPIREEYFDLFESITRLRVEIENQRQSVQHFEKLSMQLDTSEQDRARLVTGHFIPYETGYSVLVPQLDQMAVAAGVKKSQVDFVQAETPQYGLYSVKIRIPVQGGYTSIVNFIKDLEHSETFFIIESLDVQKAIGQTPSISEISLSLSLETFLYQ